MITDADLHMAKEKIRKGVLSQIGDLTLIALANGSNSAPACPDATREWAEREGLPLMQELAFRLRRALLWIIPPGGESITAEGLLQMGFHRDDSTGHAIFLREAIDEIEGCHTALHLIPDHGGCFAAEIHNWQTEEGERVCDVNQRIAIPRILETYNDVRNLCAAVSERWH